MIKSSLAAGCAAAALLLAPGVASAQDAQAALEARIAQLEAELNALKSEVVAARTQQAAQQQDIIRLETRPTPAPAPVAAPVLVVTAATVNTPVPEIATTPALPPA